MIKKNTKTSIEIVYSLIATKDINLYFVYHIHYLHYIVKVAPVLIAVFSAGSTTTYCLSKNKRGGYKTIHPAQGERTAVTGLCRGGSQIRQPPKVSHSQSLTTN